MRAAAKWSVRGLLVVLLLAVGAAGYAVGQQWFFRWRASRLLEDVRKLEVRKSDWADVQRLMTRWGKWGHYEGTCDASHCSYDVELQDSFPQRWYPYDDAPRHERGRRWLADMGVHPASASAGFEFSHGRVVTKYLFVDVQDPFHDRMDSIGVSSAERSRLDEVAGRVDPAHPYRLFGRVKYDYLEVETTPSESGEEKDRLMQFRLGCITAIRPCRDSADLLLKAADETVGLVRKGIGVELPDCRIPLWIAGRDATGVVVVDIVLAKRVTWYEDGTPLNPSVWEAKGRITKVLKGNFDGLPGRMMPVEIPEPIPGVAPGGAFPYRSVIGMGIVARPDSQSVNGPWDMPFCSAVEATAANVAEVERGVAEDYNPAQPWE